MRLAYRSGPQPVNGGQSRMGRTEQSENGNVFYTDRNSEADAQTDKQRHGAKELQAAWERSGDGGTKAG